MKTRSQTLVKPWARRHQRNVALFFSLIVALAGASGLFVATLMRLS